MRHVQGLVDFLDRAATHACCRLVTIVQQSNLIDSIQFSRLRRNVGSGKIETSEKVLGPAVVDLLGYDSTIPILVKLRRLMCQQGLD